MRFCLRMFENTHLWNEQKHVQHKEEKTSAWSQKSSGKSTLLISSPLLKHMRLLASSSLLLSAPALTDAHRGSRAVSRGYRRSQSWVCASIWVLPDFFLFFLLPFYKQDFFSVWVQEIRSPWTLNLKVFVLAAFSQVSVFQRASQVIDTSIKRQTKVEKHTENWIRAENSTTALYTHVRWGSHSAL